LNSVRVRFAPSPTGELHVGGARTALLNWLFAKSKGGTFLLRIDDTDQERSQGEYLEGIFGSLEWMGLDWDEGPQKGGKYGPYFQSQRLGLYREYVQKLLDEGKAYRCFCTEEELEAGRKEARQKGIPFVYPGKCRDLSQEELSEMGQERETSVVRFSSPGEGSTVIKDEIKGEISFENRYLGDFIILKSNGVPTYNFATAVDELTMEISHVIRAEEHLSNTPLQLLIIQALEGRIPSYAHVPMILAPDRSKLSKRHGATSVEEFKDQGYLPEALVNYLTLLGCPPVEEQEIFTSQEAMDSFSLSKIGKTPAVYDTDKLGWINGHYIREKDLEQLADLSIPFFQDKGLISPQVTDHEKEKLKQVISVSRDRVRTLQELPELCAFFFTDNYPADQETEEKVLNKEDVVPNLQKLVQELKGLDDYQGEHIQSIFKKLSKENQVSPARFIKPARVALSGKASGPELVDIMLVLGKEKTLERLYRVVNAKNKF